MNAVGYGRNNDQQSEAVSDARAFYSRAMDVRKGESLIIYDEQPTFNLERMAFLEPHYLR